MAADLRRSTRADVWVNPHDLAPSAVDALAQLEAYAKSAGLALSSVAGKVPVSLDPCRPRIGGQCGSLLAIRVDPDPDHVAVLVVDPPPAAVQVRRAGALFV